MICRGQSRGRGALVCGYGSKHLVENNMEHGQGKAGVGPCSELGLHFVQHSLGGCLVLHSSGKVDSFIEDLPVPWNICTQVQDALKPVNCTL